MDIPSMFNLFGFGIVTGLVSWLLTKVYDMDRKIYDIVKIQSERINVIDEAVGEMSDIPFNSRHVSEGRQPAPTFKKYKKILTMVPHARQ